MHSTNKVPIIDCQIGLSVPTSIHRHDHAEEVNNDDVGMTEVEVKPRRKMCEYGGRCCIPTRQIDYMYHAYVNYAFLYRNMTPC